MKFEIKKYLNLALAGLLLSSCSYKVDKEAEQPVMFDGAKLSFNEVRSMALGPKCARCHDFVASYADTKALASEISDRVQGIGPFRQMPPASASQLTSNEKAAIVAWVAAGAREIPGQVDQPVTPPPVTPPPVEPPAPEKLTFAVVKAKVIDAKCLRCHKTDFDTFEHTAPLIQDIKFRIQDIGGMDQMPPEGKTQLTPEEKTLVLDWIQAGAPKE
jgi:uncharacterized membrane protein